MKELRRARRYKTWKGALKASIAHWRRMVDFAETMAPRHSFSLGLLRDNLGETPSSECCALCATVGSEVSCIDGECPLSGSDSSIYDCCDEYDEVMGAATWGAFAKAGRGMLDRLEHELSITRRGR